MNQKNIEKKIRQTISRRDFLYSSLFLSFSATVFSVMSCSASKYQGRLSILTEHEAQILEAIMHVFYPFINESRDSKIRDFKYVENIENYLHLVDDALLDQFRLSLKIVEYGPYVLTTSFKRFSVMNRGDQKLFLESFMRSKYQLKKSIFEFIKLISTAAYYQNSYAVSRYIGVSPLGSC